MENTIPVGSLVGPMQIFGETQRGKALKNVFEIIRMPFTLKIFPCLILLVFFSTLMA